MISVKSTRIFLVMLVAALSISYALTAHARQAPNFPFPQHLHYGEDTITPNQFSRVRMDKDVQAFYDYWKSNYVVRVKKDSKGRPLYRVSSGKRGTSERKFTVSEGQGFGMIIVALMAGYDNSAREIFDGLRRYAKAHPSRNEPKLMSWKVFKKHRPRSSAFDGDADIAYALLIAHKQWSSQGPIHYKSAARQLIKTIRRATLGPDNGLPMLSDAIDPYGELYDQYSNRTSDFMLAHFRTFHRFSKNRAWKKAIVNSSSTLQRLLDAYSPHCGLLPDFIEPIWQSETIPRPAAPYFLEDRYDGNYSHNAARIPLRIGMDALLHKNQQSKQLLSSLSLWAQRRHGDNPHEVHAGYFLDGEALPARDYFSTAFVAPFGVAAMNLPNQQSWLNNIYNAVRKERQNYFSDSINLLSMLLMTGNFWDPSRI